VRKELKGRGLAAVASGLHSGLLSAVAFSAAAVVFAAVVIAALAAVAGAGSGYAATMEQVHPAAAGSSVALGETTHPDAACACALRVAAAALGVIEYFARAPAARRPPIPTCPPPPSAAIFPPSPPAARPQPLSSQIAAADQRS